MIDSFNLIQVTAFPIEELGLTKMNAQDVSRDLFTRASEILTQEGLLNSIVFVFTDTSCLLISAESFLENNTKKDALSFLLRKLAQDSSIKGIAFVLDVYARPATEKEVHTGIQEANSPVAECANKHDAIVVQCEWHDGTQYMLSGMYTKRKDAHGIESIKVEEPIGSNVFDSRFSNLFPPTRRGEYFN
jgi:hypothetical protein